MGEASGIFPIENGTYNEKYIEKLIPLLRSKDFAGDIRDILPTVLRAGEGDAVLTEEGAKLLDPTGTLEAGVKLCPPEGDAGTGMVATNSVLPGTGNVSAGTSIFSMLVLSKPLSGY